MKKLLPFSDDAILVKVAQRAALLHRAAQLEVDAINQQFTRYCEDYMAAPEVVAMLDDPAVADVRGIVREKLAHLIRHKFVADRSVTDAVTKPIRDRAYAILPATIESHMWGPDTCGCKLQRIGDGVDQQTVLAAACARHAGMLIDKLHDAVVSENGLKNDFVGAIGLTDAPPPWSFNDVHKLVVDMTGRSAGNINKAKGTQARPEFKDRVIVDG